ncbi:MAG TPA: sugar nucleotide-binding protein [Vicinamibacteria bacterium]|nr:sugar nucleotide-binding protein [Vicinamibacteria bacterium]
MRVLVTGAGGLLGGRLAALLHEAGLEVTAAHRRTPPPPGPRAVRAELTDDVALGRLLDAVRPEALLHAAVIARAEDCERRPREAERTNALLPGRLGRLCAERGIRLVALSTDLVFGGTSRAADETLPPAPLGVYGRTKRVGEESLLAACPAAAVARVALVVGRGHGPRGTASESIAWALLAGRPVRLFTDEYRTPVDPESVADGCRRLLASGARGFFHLGGAERLSRYALGVRVAQALGLAENGLTPTRQADHAGPDPRPADVSLDSGRAWRELGWRPRPLDVALREGRRAPD